MSDEICQRIFAVPIRIKLHETVLGVFSLQIPIVRDSGEADFLRNILRYRRFHFLKVILPVSEVNGRNAFKPLLPVNL